MLTIKQEDKHQMMKRSEKHAIIFCIETTASCSIYWKDWKQSFLNPLLHQLQQETHNSRINKYEFLILSFGSSSIDGYSDGILEQSQWTSDFNEILNIFDSLHFTGLFSFN